MNRREEKRGALDEPTPQPLSSHPGTRKKKKVKGNREGRVEVL